MGDNEESKIQERKNLERQASDARAARDACQDRIDDIEETLERLKRVERSVASIKEDFKKNVRDVDKDLRSERLKWKGDTRDHFKDWMDLVHEGNKNYYKNSLDHVHDSLNNEITRLENKLLEEYGIFGKLCGKINSLKNKIKNLLN